MYLHKSPRLFNFLYPKLTWEVDTKDKSVYLTFDDGPVPGPTEFVLNELEKANAKATFFCVGDNVKKHPGLARLIKKKGHRLANHSYNHLNGWQTKDKDYLENIRYCDTSLNEIEIKKGIKLFRPPYGKIKRSQIKKLISTHSIVMWSLLSGDFDQNLKVEKALVKLKRHTQKGSIVLFHDSAKSHERLQYLLPAYLRYLETEGYKCLAL